MGTGWRPRRTFLGGVNRTVLYWTAVFAVMGCGGGGCSSCDGCGVAPIPGGFPIEERVPNSAQIRLTESGLGFIEDNAESIVGLLLPDGLDFEIPPTDTSVDSPIFLCSDPTDIEVCRDGNCVVRGTIGTLDLAPTPSNELVATLRLQLESRRCTARDGGGSCTATEAGPLNIQLDGGFACSGGIDATIDTTGGSRPDIGIVAQIALAEETEAARAGYTKVEVLSVDLEDGRDIEDADVSFDGAGGLIGVLADLGILNLVKGLLVDAIQDQVGGLLQGVVDDQLCTTQGEFGCPNGTVADGSGPDAVCRFSADGECVPILLGTDGQGDLGAAFLGGISPGTHGPGQFVLAAGGEGEAVNDGMSVFMYGGFISTNRDFSVTPGHNSCVPVVEPPEIPTIPRVATFRGNSVPGLAEDPHVGIGVSESFLNHAGYGFFDGGLLCIGAGTPLAQELSTGLFSLLVMSLGDLTFPERNQPLAVGLRPQQPPVFEVGEGTEDDPLLAVALNELAVDFYVWSSERYIRFMTWNADMTVNLNLSVADGEIVPEVVGIDAENATVTNHEDLLTEDPDELAGIIRDVITMFADMFTSGLGGFALPELMGLELQVPEGGIQGVEESGEEFLGIFANLAVAGPSSFSFPTQTNLTVGELELDRTAMQLETWRDGALPKLTVWVTPEGPEGVDFEHSWRIDGRHWSPWTTGEELVIEDDALLFQARHELEVRSRVVGEPDSVDVTPAWAEVLVDIRAPEIWLTPSAQGTHMTAVDILSDEEHVDYRWRAVGDEWSAWEPMNGTEIDFPAAEVEVEVRDESGNVGSASNALIRGRPNPAAAGGCGCRVPGDEGRNQLPMMLLALVGFAFVRRRRSTGKRASKGGVLRVPFLFVMALALVVGGGCDCGGGTTPPDSGVPFDGEPPPPPDAPGTDAGPRELVPLMEGQLATYLDMAATGDGTLLFSGYAAGVPPRASYGDLVVGEWDSGAGEVSWTIVDGVPSADPTGSPDGWRGGISAPGDDVGLWTSIVSEGSDVWVAYHDRTNGALKFAAGGTDEFGTAESWSTHVVDEEGISGMYTSMVSSGGGPAVAYLQVVPPASLPGRPIARVRVGTASGTPGSAGDWSLETVVERAFECRPEFCPEDTFCTEGGVCAAEGGSCDECGSDEECIDGACTAVLPDPYVEDVPPAIGLHNSLAATGSGLALVFYARGGDAQATCGGGCGWGLPCVDGSCAPPGGNLFGVAQDGGAWGEPFLIDGYATGEEFVGDSGIGADLFVDEGGVWHVSYVDGAEETLRYARIEGETIDTQVVDDGSTDGSAPHPDGRHIVGDDSAIVVVGGEVRIAYQDVTAQTAVFARSGEDAWTIQVIDDADSTGYWTNQALVGSTSWVSHWFRQEMRGMEANGVRVQSID